MAIISAKVSFSPIKGITLGVDPLTGSAVSGRDKTIYIPRVSMQIEGRKTAKSGYLDVERFSKKDYKGIGLLEEFIVIVTTTEYITVGEDCAEHKALKIADTGKIVGGQKEGFICLKGKTVNLYNIEGEILGSRELTDEELKQLSD